MEKELTKSEVLRRIITVKGKGFAETLISGDQAGEISHFKTQMSFSTEFEDIFDKIEFFVMAGDIESALTFGLRYASIFENDHKYWEALRIYELINEVTPKFKVLKKGMIYHEERGNFGYAAGFAERLGDKERAEVYNYLHKIQLELED